MFSSPQIARNVWVELICYAAANCKPNVHAQQPSKGGELLTFIWLCMSHLDAEGAFPFYRIRKIRQMQQGRN
ncbi:hypothetical protein SLEP1_g47895 [Rubroshorea leprosula]|uniref:Uncharacterized protein n=1 Tax=Rubroshorea leprosula TaxID=152421 RepID=A0AAV5LST7_9ROSI|nr:hypothetical protein SLEP1_g47895 [Rubroshorea leprosula]